MAPAALIVSSGRGSGSVGSWFKEGLPEVKVAEVMRREITCVGQWLPVVNADGELAGICGTVGIDESAAGRERSAQGRVACCRFLWSLSAAASVPPFDIWSADGSQIVSVLPFSMGRW
jgi:hypothetical protein